MNRVRYPFLSLFLLLLISGCNVTRRVPQGDYLYQGAVFSNVDSVDAKVLSEAEKKVPSRVNTRFLGIPYKLIIYNAFSKPGNHPDPAVVKMGEAPILLSQVDTLAMINRLRQQFFRAGYFKSEIHVSPVKAEKTAKIMYNVKGGKRYKLGQISYPRDSSAIIQDIKSTADSSLLHPGDYFSLDILAKERDRLNEDLKNKGYYQFNPDLISYETDTLPGHGNNLQMMLKTPANLNTLKTWKLGEIIIHNSDPSTGDSTSYSIHPDPEKDSHLKISRAAGYKTSLYRRALLLKEGEVYNKQKHFLSIQRLINLETFQFVKFTFAPETSDTARLLTTNLFVTPLKRYRVKFEASAGARGNNYLGSKIASSLVNSNLFGGAEKLQLQIQGGADIQFGGYRLGANSFNIGGNLSLAIPRLLPRFKIDGGLNPSLPETKITLATSYIYIPKLFSLVLTGVTLDYKFRSNKKAEHELTPLELGTFRLNSASPLFDSVLVLVPSLQQTFRSQFLLGSGYKLWVTKPFRPGDWLQSAAGFKIKTMGNLLGLILKSRPGQDKDREILGMPIAQFVRVEGEYRGHVRANASNTLALRTILGLGVAYGNASSMPYTDQFFVGGTNSLRAFRAGTIGPGSYHNPEKVLNNIEYGDFKFEFNSEWRHAVNSTVKLAAFIDAGNIWTRRKDPAKPGADLSHFLSEIAVGTGAGLRLDFTLLVLRFDLGVPLRKPWYPRGHRWVFNEIDLDSKAWRKQNLILNVGVGYPF